MPPPNPRQTLHLSPSQLDDDASSLHSRSDQDTDSEDDEVLMGARTSADIREHDRSVLLEEEERDRLLEESRRRRGRRGSALQVVQGLFKKGSSGSLREDAQDGDRDRNAKGETTGGDESRRLEKRRARRQRRARKKERLLGQSVIDGEDGELMYEMEEGGMKEGSGTGESSEAEFSDEIDRHNIRHLQNEKSARRRRWWRWCFIHLLIAVGFSILVLGAWKLSLNREKAWTKAGQEMMFNGSALFAPTTILISLDGFRADFLRRGITPTLNKFVEEGVSPQYMLPSFPSVTFPNHYTIVTGLYPESHGVVGNTFWDAGLHEEFYYTHPDAMQPKWWGGEPLWATAENQGIRSAIHMWPGSEANIMGVVPTFLDKYNGKEPLPNKVDRILGLLDRPGLENVLAEVATMRPQLIAAYVPNVDTAGHLYGPNSTEIRTTINDVDTMLDLLFQGLESRNLTDIVNVVVVSDHGMATTDTNRLIQLEDIIDISLIEHTDGWPLYGLRPKDSGHLQGLYDVLAAEAASNPNFDVYLRDENMPDRYHFSNNERIAPLWIVPKTGWAIVTKGEFNVAEVKENGEVYHPRGLHGYDHEHPLMRAIFIARGPAFPHAGNSRVDPFQNIEVYNIVCDSLGLSPKPNNGTLRLPLKPVGLHVPDTSPEEQDPPPPNAIASPAPSPASSEDESVGIISISPIEASSAADPNVRPPVVVGVDPADLPDAQEVDPTDEINNTGDEINVDRPVVGDDTVVSEEEKSFWDWVQAELDGLKGWLSDTVGGEEAPHSGDGGDAGDGH